METCSICKKKFILSDPNHFSFENGEGVCKGCFLIVFEKTSWGAKREQRIVFEYKKVSIPHKLKWEVWKRDGFACISCGVKDNLSVDHITPEAFGGELEMCNLQTLCRSCNSKKNTKHG